MLIRMKACSSSCVASAYNEPGVWYIDVGKYINCTYL